MIYNEQDSICYKPFRSNLYNLEEYLTLFEKVSTIPNQEDLKKHSITYISMLPKK